MSSPCSQQGLPPPHVTVQSCELLPHSFHPYYLSSSFVSVALSLESPLVAVSNCRSLCCPDFPPRSRLLSLPPLAVSFLATQPGRSQKLTAGRSTNNLTKAIIPYFADSASKTSFTSASASLLSSRGTCWYVTLLKCTAKSLMD